MADRKITLELSAPEEEALSEVLRWACDQILADKMPRRVEKHRDQIGHLNAAVNAVR